ncbi:hypothetical protein BX616_003490 [Lobosporangium transversale]|uniref:Uncharacterized protein n=1 Tax=Lobosporangium transversale TaxID=64571 RepID=A0A1Y2GWC7_9FUNG|nr:hypothetical protein BCR41DRAFT_347546 [Lobosporangium transversale]KAF9898882.1 hypothetical protein BX616_003490 [Lobosporangium transversale]ORZ26565.1 hypothetical protein BCR41DRAFT_347546 [Lobosporangium transversale]|eukprot:XP_021884328.1 hypothetical protein BCR41DRAFT_347546 [Lobosporangium transversale]
MLSLIGPSSSPCLHSDSFAVPPSSASTSNCIGNKSIITTSTSTIITTSSPSQQSPPLKSSPSTAPLNNSSNYKEIVAQFTARAPQPYGVIPPRRKRDQSKLIRSSSASSISTSNLNKNPNSINKKNPSSSSSTPSSPTETSHNAVELQQTSFNPKNKKNNDSSDCRNGSTQIVRPLFHSLQSLILPESTSSSTRLGFWANLKAHYLAAATTTLSWSVISSQGPQSSASTRGRGAVDEYEFSPPIALRLSNSTPVAAVDAIAPHSASLSMTDAYLSLPNLATPASHASYHQHGSVTFPVSVAAMDRFKPDHSDTIPLKTFTYHETPVIERPQPLPLPLPLSSNKRGNNAAAASKKATSNHPSSPSTKRAKNSSNGDADELLPLPRHLATRETRSNTNYLRMMAAELRMIRSRKLVSPLKPRGYLPRRKDPFRRVKSPLCNSLELLREEDDHPLNDIMVGSWSSVSSTDSYLSSSSSEYQTANEGC